MKQIDFSKWAPRKDDPRFPERAGQRSAVEVFKELEQRLKNVGMLPDEYFMLNSIWEDGRDIPEGADIFVTTDYGESEGIYLDVYLKWHEANGPVTEKFITGKTLAETGAAMDRMFLIASAITKAFHGDQGQYDRYFTLHPEEDAGEMLVNLTPKEHKLCVEALVERRERMLDQVDSTEQLLRRMVGSITEYMNLVGERPLHISDYDRASLAVRDGELSAFKELYPKVMDRVGDLLGDVAGRCGKVGRQMIRLLLSDVKQVSADAYLAASKAAVEIGEAERVRFFMEQAASYVWNLDKSYYGQIIDHALDKGNIRMATDLIRAATPDQIAAAPPSMLYHASTKDDYPLMLDLLKKGARPGEYASKILQPLTYENRNSWMAEGYLKNGMMIEPDDYSALYTCIKNDAVECAKLILDQGMDLAQYSEWAEQHGKYYGHLEIMEQLSEYWVEMHSEQVQGQGPVMEGQ